MKNAIKYLLITYASIMIVIVCIDNYKMSKTVKELSERIDSINAPYEKFNRNCDSVLYELYGPNCPVCGHSFKHYSEEK